MVDVPFGADVDDSNVIQIEVEGDDPFEGWVREISRTRPLRAATEIRFSGLLGLLQAVVMIIDGGSSGQVADGFGRQLGARGDSDLAENVP